MSVQTVLGPIGRSSLGIVTPHEHIFIDLSGFYAERPIKGCELPSLEPIAIDKLGILNRDPYALRDNLMLDDTSLQRSEILQFKHAGGGTVVDATMPGIGRNVSLLREIARETGLNIVVGTGFYVEATHPPEISGMSVQAVSDIMLREINEGIEGSGIKAGVIGEIGISETFAGAERKVLKAAAKAQAASGLGVLVHINPWTTHGLEAAEILLDAGVRPDKVCICHVDVENRQDYIIRMLDMGVYVEFDNFGKEYYVNREARRPGYGVFVKDTDRVSLLKRLVEAGYVGRLLLSCDVCLKTLLHAYGGWGYDHLLTNVVPMMREEGIGDDQIDIMMRDNPADFLDVP